MAVLNANDMGGPTLLRSVELEEGISERRFRNDIEYYAKYSVVSTEIRKDDIGFFQVHTAVSARRPSSAHVHDSIKILF